MKEAESGIIALYGDSPRMRALEYFMVFPKNEFTVGEIVEAVGMSRTTAFKEISKLLDNGMIIQSGKIRKSPTYKIDIKNPLIKVMQKSVSYRSGQIADRQDARKNIVLLIRSQINADALNARKKLLNNELRLTKNMIKEISVK
ncbi:MAG: hypothetical protein LVO36_01570 [Nitrosopumilus sp. (ex Thoosa mismalolli)]|nr:hypothetical protein [Nitrosopumilus sp. (ex Thoosa mismalolli)]